MVEIDASGLVTEIVPVEAARLLTALGTFAGHSSACDGYTLSPLALIAATANTYVVPSVKPVTVKDD